MSLRITTDIRKRIVYALIDHRFDKEFLKLRQEAQAIALEIVKGQLNKKQHELMASLPENWLGLISRVKIRLQSLHHGLPNDIIAIQLDHPIPIPAFLNGVALTASLEHESRLIANERAEAELRKLQHESRIEINQMISQFSTIGSLIKGWPEIEPFVKKLGLIESDKKLPSVVPAELNAKLGLPV